MYLESWKQKEIFLCTVDEIKENKQEINNMKPSDGILL